MAVIIMLLATIAIVLVVLYAASIIWGILFASALPGFVGGLLGGITALPIWQSLKKIRHAPDQPAIEQDKEGKTDDKLS